MQCWRDQCAVRSHANRLRKDLESAGAQWLSGYGYLNAWQWLHYAEEALVLVAPREYVRERAVEAANRLEGSTMKQASSLRDRVNQAADDLGNRQREEDARHDVHYVLGEVNRYREDRWGALVVYRDQLMTATAVLWMVLYAALMLAVGLARSTPAASRQTQIATATAFFLAGAGIGLISQLYSLARQDPSQSAVEDFGLSTARVLAIPAFSGTVALAGVVVVAALHLEVNGQHLTAGTDGLRVDWPVVFDWRANGVGFAWAALFALAPDRLFDLLRNTRQLKAEIHSSEASGASS